MELDIDVTTSKARDPDELARILRENGVGLVSAGNAAQVIEGANYLRSPARNAAPIRLAVAYASYVLGNYNAALAEIAEATLSTDLPDDDRELAAFLRRAIDYQTGRYDLQEYLRRQQEWLEQSHGPLALSVRLDTGRYAIPLEQD